MKKIKIIRDERVITQMNRIQGEAYIIISVVLFSSVIVQQIFFDAPFKQYAVELFCVVGIAIYTIIRSIIAGINLEGTQGKINTFTVMFFVGMLVTIIQGTKNYTAYSEMYQRDGMGYFIAVLVVLFISSSILGGLVIMVLNYINKIRQQSIQRALDEEETKD